MENGQQTEDRQQGEYRPEAENRQQEENREQAESTLEKQEQLKKAAGEARGFFILFLVVSCFFLFFGAVEKRKAAKLVDMKGRVTETSIVGTRTEVETDDNGNPAGEEDIDYQWLAVSIDAPDGSGVETFVTLDEKDGFKFPAEVGDVVPVIYSSDNGWMIGKAADSKKFARFWLLLAGVFLAATLLIHYFRVRRLKDQMSAVGLDESEAYGRHLPIDGSAVAIVLVCFGILFGCLLLLIGLGGGLQDMVSQLFTFEEKTPDSYADTAEYYHNETREALETLPSASSGLEKTEEASNTSGIENTEDPLAPGVLAALKPDGTLPGEEPEEPTELGDDLSDNRVELNGKIYQLPISVPLLYANGWQIWVPPMEPGQPPIDDSLNVYEDTVIGPHQIENHFACLINKEGDRFEVWLVNFSEQDAEAKDCAVAFFSPTRAGGNDPLAPLPCSFPGGLLNTMPADEWESRLRDMGFTDDYFQLTGDWQTAHFGAIYDSREWRHGITEATYINSSYNKYGDHFFEYGVIMDFGDGQLIPEGF